MAATVLTIANQKGGVGKTTTAVNLAAGLAERRIPTLLIDMDPQGNATSGLNAEKAERGSLYPALHEDAKAGQQVIPTGIENLYLIPAEVDLAALEIELAQRPEYLVQLRRCLAELRREDKFGAIIIDCPPSLGLISMNSLAAADYLLIAQQCEYMAMEGLGQILRVVEQLRTSGANPELALGGIVMTMFDRRTNLAHQVVEEVRSHFSKDVFKTIIPRSVRLGEAPSFGQTIFQYDRSGVGAEAYRNLAREVAKRFALKA